LDILIPASAGELIDKITILEIKLKNIVDPVKNRNVAITNINEEINKNLTALKFVENIGSENIGGTLSKFFQKINNDFRA